MNEKEQMIYLYWCKDCDLDFEGHEYTTECIYCNSTRIEMFFNN